MTQTPILVLGGTGKTGRPVARQIAELGRACRVASRSGQQFFDWRDTRTWSDALDGVEAVYVVDEQSHRAAELLTDFTALAARKGVTRCVLLSARMLEQWAHDESMFGAERAVRESGVGWTILRPTWFAQNFSEDPFLSVDIDRGEVVLPDWSPDGNPERLAGVAVDVLRRGEDGKWRYVVDNPYAIEGPLDENG